MAFVRWSTCPTWHEFWRAHPPRCTLAGKTPRSWLRHRQTISPPQGDFCVRRKAKRLVSPRSKESEAAKLREPSSSSGIKRGTLEPDEPGHDPLDPDISTSKKKSDPSSSSTTPAKPKEFKDTVGEEGYDPDPDQIPPLSSINYCSTNMHAIQMPFGCTMIGSLAFLCVH